MSRCDDDMVRQSDDVMESLCDGPDGLMVHCSDRLVLWAQVKRVAGEEERRGRMEEKQEEEEEQ
eukprot:822166-Rhodomonas_salina.3